VCGDRAEHDVVPRHAQHSARQRGKRDDVRPGSRKNLYSGLLVGARVTACPTPNEQTRISGATRSATIACQPVRKEVVEVRPTSTTTQEPGCNEKPSHRRQASASSQPAHDRNRSRFRYRCPKEAAPELASEAFLGLQLLEYPRDRDGCRFVTAVLTGERKIGVLVARHERLRRTNRGV